MHPSAYKLTQTYDPTADQLLLQISGRIFIGFFEGDQGPSGQVETGGALLSVVGNAQITVDGSTGEYTSFSLTGRFTDLCPLLAG